MNTYISAFLPLTENDKNKPNTIRIHIPIATDSDTPESTVLTGILENDISFSLGNKFGPILPDAADLQTLFALAGATQMPAWIGSSAQVWKGTDPISLSFDMYIVNWSPECNSEKNLKRLAQLCTVTPMNKTIDGDTSRWRVRVHGNYKAAVLQSNKDFLDKGIQNIDVKKGKDGKVIQEAAASESLSEWAVTSSTNKTEDGTITIEVGAKIKLSSLILTRCNITPSVVEVYSPAWDTTEKSCPPRPLYYRVGLSMQTCRAALSTDVPSLFGLSE